MSEEQALRDRRQLIEDYSAANRALVTASGTGGTQAMRTALTECTFQRAADIGFFNRRYPGHAITEQECNG